jgi:tetratricopeptide (TPR) repeat protein
LKQASFSGRRSYCTSLGCLCAALVFEGCGLSPRSRQASALTQAEEFSGNGEFERSISAYEEHIKTRLDSTKPEWENPFFYYLKIGDIYLRQNQPDKAISAYLTAKQKGIDKLMISDRLRALASWYEKNKQLEQALKLLTTHSELDPILFNAMLDRIARKLSDQEQTVTSPEPDSLLDSQPQSSH